MSSDDDEKYYTDYPTVPIGEGNPYWQCAHCGRADPGINGRLDGHYKDCEYRIRKEAEIRVEKILSEPLSDSAIDALKQVVSEMGVSALTDDALKIFASKI